LLLVFQASDVASGAPSPNHIVGSNGGNKIYIYIYIVFRKESEFE